MTSPVVELSIRNPLTQVAAPLGDYLYFQGTRTANTIGRARLTLPGDFPQEWLRRGNLIDAWWTPYRPYALRPWRTYEIQKAIFTDDTNGLRTWTVEALDLKHMLTKRRVRAYKGSAKADKEGRVEAVMKAYLDEQQRGLVRAYGLAIAPSYGIGPVVKKEASRANLYTVLSDLAKAATEQGVYTYFDIMEDYRADGSVGTRFEVWLNEVGVDQGEGSPNPLILSKSTGTISKLEWTEDAEKETNSVQVGGKGDGTDRTSVIVEDTLRARAYPGALSEGWAEKNDTADARVLTSAGEKALHEGDIKRSVTVTFTDSFATRIGRDLNHGDRCLVHIEQLGLLLPARLSALTLTSDKGRVSVTGALGIFEADGG